MSARSAFVSRRYTTAKEFIDNCASSLIKTRATQANHPLAAPYDRLRTPSGTSEEWLISIVPESSGVSMHSPDIIFTLTVMDIHPGFLACSIDPKDLPKVFITTAMQALVHAAIEANLSPSRLSSVLAPTSLGYPFADEWAAMHHITRKETPILHLAQSYITRDTMRPGVKPDLENFDLDYVTEEETESAAVLIVEFTRTSPRSLNWEAALKLAKALIKDRELTRATIDGKMLAYVKIARRTPGVKAIANVYTKPEARGKGLAEALVRFTVHS
jgi:GNAT superfamily N-acetyltransferase